MASAMMDKLREIRERSKRNAEHIQEATRRIQDMHLQQQQPYFSQRHQQQMHGYANSQELQERLLNDFMERNKHIIDSQLQYERAKYIVNDVLQSVNEYDNARLEQQIAANPIMAQLMQNRAVPMTISDIKQIIIKPSADESEYSEDGENAEVDLELLSDAEREKITGFVDKCYKHIIKVLKVYFILGDGKQYFLPNASNIQNMKTVLEGCIHIQDIKQATIYPGTHIYYLSVNENSQIEMLEGTAYKKVDSGLIIFTTGPKKNKLLISFKNPIFRKISNNDILALLSG